MKRHHSASPENQEEDVASRWKEFYTRARAFCDKEEKAIEKEERYGFPKDDDPELDAACGALSVALQNANKAEVDCDTDEVKQALDNLRKAYDEAAKSNTVMVRYIDAEPPSDPYSPLTDRRLQRILLARSWMMELIKGLRDQSFPDRLVVIGNPGIGEFLR
jgi:hypothetical protein